MDTILFFNGSEKMNDFLLVKTLKEISKFRGIEYYDVPDAKEFLQNFIARSFNPKRGQVNSDIFLKDFHSEKAIQECWREGKIVLLDQDLYGSDASGWCFGGFTGTKHGLGYIVMSTARFQDNIQASDILRHEIGHMFNAPSEGRINTTESLGLHCSNRLCVMQQKLTVLDSIKYSHERARMNAETYCQDCSNDIRNYILRERA